MKLKTAPLAAGLGLCLGLAACTAYPPSEPVSLAPPPPSGAGLTGTDCFRSSDIRNHTVVDPQTLFVRTNRGEVFRVSMSGACLAGANSSDPLILRQPPGSAVVCRPLDLDVGVAKSGFESRCIVDSIAPVAPAEVEALPPRLRP